MSEVGDFPSSGQKLLWSRLHLDQLKKRVEAFVNDDPVRIVRYNKPKRPGFDLVFEVNKATPPDVPMRVGDVIGNMRDSLDHLVYELGMSYSNTADRFSAFPILVHRSAWPRYPKSGSDNHRSGEYKIRHIDPRLWKVVKSLQPFYRKRRDNPRPKHGLWILDELRNIDRHRRLTVVPVSAYETRTGITLPSPAWTVDRLYVRRRPPKDGAIVESYRLPVGLTQDQVGVDTKAQAALALKEPSAHQRYSDLIRTLEELHKMVYDILRMFASLTAP